MATEQKAQPEGVSVELHVYPEPLVVQVSDAQVARAVTNLIRNAVESLGGSGRVIVQTEAVRLVRAYAAYESIEPGDYAVVRVKDSGRGIDQADLGRIFEPFFTKKRTSESSGSGLGLSIVHGVVKEHDGFVDVVSEAGRGAEFTLYFRRSREAEPRRESRPSLVRGTASLLVVDDDPVQLRTARRVLTRLGYEIETTRSGVEALAICTGPNARHYDLVIIDMLLNEREDGLAVFERLERLVPGQRGMIVSGHAPDERVRLATNKGLAWLAKPYGRDELARAVHAALSPASSSVRPVAGALLEEPVAEGALALARRASQRP